MNCPECDELKARYEKCLADYANDRLAQFGFGASPRSASAAAAQNQCEEPFQVLRPSATISNVVKLLTKHMLLM